MIRWMTIIIIHSIARSLWVLWPLNWNSPQMREFRLLLFTNWASLTVGKKEKIVDLLLSVGVNYIADKRRLIFAQNKTYPSGYKVTLGGRASSSYNQSHPWLQQVKSNDLRLVHATRTGILIGIIIHEMRSVSRRWRRRQMSYPHLYL